VFEFILALLLLKNKMQFYFGICLCAAILAFGECMFLEPNLDLLGINFGSQIRSKRDVNVTHLDDPNGCLLKCNNELLDGLYTVTAEKSLADARCRAQLQALACFDKCSPSQLKDLLKSSSEMINLMCSDAGKKYVSNYTCLQQVLPPVNTTCDEICKDSGNASLAILNSIHYSDFGTIFYEADSSVVAKEIADVCKLFQCKAKCTIPAINNKCGAETADTSSKVTKVTLSQCINSYKILGVWRETPSECKAIL